MVKDNKQQKRYDMELKYEKEKRAELGIGHLNRGQIDSSRESVTL